MEQFYVQQYARQAMMRIVPLPARWETRKTLPFDLTSEQWLEALSRYRQWLASVLQSVQQTPDLFGMVQIPIDPAYQGKVNADEHKSIVSFSRLETFLTTLAKDGEITEDGGLFCSYEALKKAKIPKLESLLTGISAGSIILHRQNKDVLLHSYDNQNIFCILKAFILLDGCKGLMTADIRHLQKNPGEGIAYTVEDIVRWMPSHQQTLVKELCGRFADHGYHIKAEYGENPARIRITKTLSGKDTVTIEYTRRDRLSIAMRLLKLDTYADKLNELTPNMQAQTVAGRTCCYCGYCKEGCVSFTWQQTQYEKCSLICCGFVYINPADEDRESLLRLAHYEWGV